MVSTLISMVSGVDYLNFFFFVSVASTGSSCWLLKKRRKRWKNIDCLSVTNFSTQVVQSIYQKWLRPKLKTINKPSKLLPTIGIKWNHQLSGEQQYMHVHITMYDRQQVGERTQWSNTHTRDTRIMAWMAKNKRLTWHLSPIKVKHPKVVDESEIKPNVFVKSQCYIKCALKHTFCFVSLSSYIFLTFHFVWWQISS